MGRASHPGPKRLLGIPVVGIKRLILVKFLVGCRPISILSMTGKTPMPKRIVSSTASTSRQGEIDSFVPGHHTR